MSISFEAKKPSGSPCFVLLSQHKNASRKNSPTANYAADKQAPGRASCESLRIFVSGFLGVLVSAVPGSFRMDGGVASKFR